MIIVGAHDRRLVGGSHVVGWGCLQATLLTSLRDGMSEVGAVAQAQGSLVTKLVVRTVVERGYGVKGRSGDSG